jgi:arylsulfatase A
MTKQSAKAESSSAPPQGLFRHLSSVIRHPSFVFPAMRSFLVLLVCTIASALAADPRPNIVLIYTDDLGINDLSCYGRKDQRTPHLDRLAAQGMRFTSAYCAQPICSPSRAALMTGKTPARLHLTNFLPGRADAPSQKLLNPVIEGQLPLEEITLAEALRDAGYATACIGKWHLGGKGFGPEAQGFQHVVAGKPNTPPTATEGSKGEYALTAAANQWIEENQARPFFLYLAHNTPHIPYAARPEDAAKHGDAFSPVYADVIARMDETIGLLLAKLDALALAEKTIVIFASDNGGLHVLEFPGTPATHNTPFRAGKGYVYEGGLRDPLIVRWPGKVAAGVVQETPVIFTDLLPTLLAAAGVDVGKTVGPLDGVNLLPLLTGGTLAPRPLFWHFPNYTNQGGRPAGAMREGDWKLVEQYEDGSLELYDLARDLGEMRNLAKEEPARATAMQQQLAAWRRRVGAQENAANPAFDAALHRQLYVDFDPSKIAAAATSTATETKSAAWRAAMNDATKGSKARVTPASGDIRLFARDAKVHGTKLRYEPEPHKNTLGYWTQPEDWASWDFAVATAGRYEVEVQQGCKDGGSEVAVEIGGKTLAFTVVGTGHFQHFIQKTIGTVELTAGPHTLAVKPQKKQGAAVMDLRRVVLRPAL